MTKHRGISPGCCLYKQQNQRRIIKKVLRKYTPFTTYPITEHTTNDTTKLLFFTDRYSDKSGKRYKHIHIRSHHDVIAEESNQCQNTYHQNSPTTTH